MVAVTGHSEDPLSAEAIAEALGQCDAALAGRAPKAGLLYAGVDHDHALLLDAVAARYPGLPVVGCTAHGELSGDGFAEGSVALMLLAGDGLAVGTGLAEGVVADPGGTGARAIRDALAALDGPPALCVALIEAFGVDTPAMLEGMAEALGPDVPICGGLAAEPFRQGPTHQFGAGRVVRDGVAVLLVGGAVRVGTGVASGWEPMGGDHVVTGAEGPVVTHIDGAPVREVWARYFGTDAIENTPRLLAVYPDDPEAPTVDGAEFYVSTPFTWREEDDGLVVGPPIPEGARFRFSDATRAQMLAGVEASTAQALDALGTAPEAALIFSCAGRQLYLGTHVTREAEILEAQLGGRVPTIGFYTYGELCPLPGSARPCAHASTFVSVLLGGAA